MTNHELKTDDEYEVGLLRIDWGKRKWKIQGIGGHDNDLMTPAQVLEALQRPNEPNIESMAVVAWKENADGYQQLCFYSLTDFQSEVYGPVDRPEQS